MIHGPSCPHLVFSPKPKYASPLALELGPGALLCIQAFICPLLASPFLSQAHLQSFSQVTWPILCALPSARYPSSILRLPPSTPPLLVGFPRLIFKSQLPQRTYLREKPNHCGRVAVVGKSQQGCWKGGDPSLYLHLPPKPGCRETGPESFSEPQEGRKQMGRNPEGPLLGNPPIRAHVHLLT